MTMHTMAGCFLGGALLLACGGPARSALEDELSQVEDAEEWRAICGRHEQELERRTSAFDQSCASDDDCVLHPIRQCGQLVSRTTDVSRSVEEWREHERVCAEGVIDCFRAPILCTDGVCNFGPPLRGKR